MKAAPNRLRQPDSFAVTRCYRPTRIERELLTQIFDLVQRSSAVDFTNATFDPKCGVATWKDEVRLLPREQRYSPAIEQQPIEGEPTA